MVKGNNNRRRDAKEQKLEKEFEQQLVDIARVTRVKAGGKRLSFRALIVIGDKKGRVGAGVAKGADVTMAVEKAVARAKKILIEVPIIEGTIPHEITEKFKASKVFLKPAKQGRGIIAGGAVRRVLYLAGISNIVSKIRGSNSKINNVMATINALKKLKRVGAGGEEKSEAEKKESIKQENNPSLPSFLGTGKTRKQDSEKEEGQETKKLKNKEIKKLGNLEIKDESNSIN